MPPRLILNADDFGLTPGINRAIEELHQAGALTSATLMATAPAFVDAVAIAHRNPTLGIGCHIVLVDGTPAAPPDEIHTLLAPGQKTFRTSLLDFTHALLRGRIHPGHLLREITAQTVLLQSANIPLTHLDTHKHTHLFPVVTEALLQAAERHHIAAIRNPFEPPWALACGHGTPIRRLQIPALHRAFHSRFLATLARHPDIITTDGSLGISTTGHLNSTTLAQLLAALPDAGTWELVTHPGYHDPALDQTRTRLRATREIECEALLTHFSSDRANPPQPELIHYGSLTK